MNRKERFNIRISYSDGMRTYLSHKGRMEWAKSTAYKHYRDVINLSKHWVDGDKITSIELIPV